MKTKTIWQRLVESVLPKPIQDAPPMDVDRNSNTLGRLEENDPTLACVRDHLVAQFSTELVTAFDRTQPAAVRLSALDSASGLKDFIQDLELRRQGWNDERRRVAADQEKRKNQTNP